MLFHVHRQNVQQGFQQVVSGLQQIAGAGLGGLQRVDQPQQSFQQQPFQQQQLPFTPQQQQPFVPQQQPFQGQGPNQIITFPVPVFVTRRPRCVTSTGERGRCKPLSQCVTFYADVPELRKQPCPLNEVETGVCCPKKKRQHGKMFPLKACSAGAAIPTE